MFVITLSGKFKTGITSYEYERLKKSKDINKHTQNVNYYAVGTANDMMPCRNGDATISLE